MVPSRFVVFVFTFFFFFGGGRGLRAVAVGIRAFFFLFFNGCIGEVVDEVPCFVFNILLLEGLVLSSHVV